MYQFINDINSCGKLLLSNLRVKTSYHDKAVCNGNNALHYLSFLRLVWGVLMDCIPEKHPVRALTFGTSKVSVPPYPLPSLKLYKENTAPYRYIITRKTRLLPSLIHLF